MTIRSNTSRQTQVVRTVCAVTALLVSSPAHAQDASKRGHTVFAELTMPTRSDDAPKPFAGFSKSAVMLRDSIVRLAEQQIGRRYKFGGRSPKNGFDCSGLVQYVLAALHVRVPRTARRQAAMGMPIIRDARILLPGDLLTFGKTRSAVSHVGIYVGAGRYIHASRAAGRVIETRIDRPSSPLLSMWRGARRLVTDSLVDTAALAIAKP